MAANKKGSKKAKMKDMKAKKVSASKAKSVKGGLLLAADTLSGKLANPTISNSTYKISNPTVGGFNF